MQRSVNFAAWLAVTAFLAGPASAAANRAWVSGHGVDAPGCGAPTSPCRSLQYTHDNIVAAGGEIDVLDPAGYGALNITKSISVVNDGVGTAGVQTTSGIAINVNAGAADTVYLRGLNIDGVNFAGATGVQFNSGASLTLVNCVVRHFVNYGIALAPSGATPRVNISQTTSSNNLGGGLLVRPILGGTSNNVVVDGLTAQGNGGDGVTVDGGSTTGTVAVYLSNSNASNNGGDGAKIENNNTTVAALSIDRSQFDANTNGLHAQTHSTVFYSNISAFGNSTADVNNQIGAGGFFISFGNNMLNTSTGASPTRAGPF